MASDLSGRRRVLERGPFTADLNDVSRDGKGLITLFDQEEWTGGLLAGQQAESRLVSRTDLRLVDISEDGKLLVLRDGLADWSCVWIAKATARRRFSSATAWRTDSRPTESGCSPASREAPRAPDRRRRSRSRSTRIPSKPSDGRVGSATDGESSSGARRRTGRRVFSSSTPTGGSRSALHPKATSSSPRGNALSPDDLLVAARSPENQIVLCPVDGGPPRPVPGLSGYFVPVQWSADGRSVYVFRMGELPARWRVSTSKAAARRSGRSSLRPDRAGMTRARRRDDARRQALRLLLPAVSDDAVPRRQCRLLASPDVLVAPLRPKPVSPASGSALL